MEPLIHLPSLLQIASLGYWLVFLFALGESLAFVGFVVPGSLVVILAGGLAAQGFYHFQGLLLCTTLAAVLGNTVSYEFGRNGKKFLKSRPLLWKQVAKGQKFFEKHGGKGIFIGHFLGPVRHVVPVAAGAVELSRIRFQLANIAGAFLWSLLHLSVGYVFGSLWDVAILWSSRIGAVIAVFVLIGFLLFLLRIWIIRYGKTAAKVVGGFFRRRWDSFLALPSLKRWMNRHPTIVAFLRGRVLIDHFYGLPLTLLVSSIFFVTFVFFSIVEDYITKDPLIALDIRLEHLLVAFRTQPLLHFFYGVTLLASLPVILTGIVLFLIISFVQKKSVYGWALIVGLLLNQGLVTLGKLIIQRPRPELWIQALLETSSSFPSNHAATAVAFYGFLAYAATRHRRSWTTAVTVWLSMLVVVLFIDMSRLYLGVHFLSDVLAGNLVGLASLLCTIGIAEWWMGRKMRAKSSLRALSLPAVITCQAAVVIAIIALGNPNWLQPQAPVVHQIAMSDIASLFADGSLPSQSETLLGDPRQPVNVLLIVPDNCLADALARSGWIQADPLSITSTLALIHATLLQEPYRGAPMLSAFYNAETNRFGFERDTGSGSGARHHLRLWPTSYQMPLGGLFVGTASLDRTTRWGILRSVDPDIDAERDLFTKDILHAHVVLSEAALALHPLVSDEPEQQFFTDGKTMLLTLGCQK